MAGMLSHRPNLPRRGVVEYLTMLQAFLPRGLAWTRAPDAVLTRTLYASAEELARIDAAAHLLMDETNPATPVDGLEDWERVLGLPDGCLPISEDLNDRRYAVLHYLTDDGRSDLGYWYELAADLGYPDIVIEEHRPFVCGKSEVSDADKFTPEEEQASGLGRCGPEEIRYWWNVIVRGPWFVLFRTGTESRPPDPLQDLTNAANCARCFRTGASAPPDRLGEYVCAPALECVFQREKPAHTYVTFEYRELPKEPEPPLPFIIDGGYVDSDYESRAVLPCGGPATEYGPETIVIDCGAPDHQENV